MQPGLYFLIYFSLFQFTDEAFEHDLQQAILQSKLDAEEQKEVWNSHCSLYFIGIQ
jgi:hypothetical protein